MMAGEGHDTTVHGPDAFMAAAIEEAQRGLADGGIPIGRVLVNAGRILGRRARHVPLPSSRRFSFLKEVEVPF